MADTNDRIQRALNEAKRRELEERYGGIFSPSDSSLPPEIESEWLETIEDFERQFASATTTLVRHVLGNPTFPAIEEIDPGRLPDEVDRLLHVLEENGITVGFDAPVRDEDIYQFITEELLDQEIDDIRIEGMTHNFVYEEFHPNDLLDAGFSAELFLHELLDEELREIHRRFVLEPPETAPEPIADDELERFAGAVKRKAATFTRIEPRVDHCRIVGDQATVRVTLAWNGLTKESLEPFEGSQRFVITLQRGLHGAWPIVHAALDKRSENSVS